MSGVLGAPVHNKTEQKQKWHFGDDDMQRRTMTVMPILLVTACMAALSACGDNSGDSGGKIKGAKKSSSPAASPEDVPGRPHIKTPGFKLKFEDWTDSDPTSQAILNDGRERERALHAAVLKGGGTDAIRFYSKDTGLALGDKWVSQFRGEGQTLTGESRYFDPSVRKKKTDSAILTYCNDTNKGYTKDRKTNKVDRQSASAEGYIYYQQKLKRNGQGIWQTVDTLEKPGGCKP